MPIGSSLGITLPTVSVTAGPTWATSLNTALQAIITAVETRVVPSGLNINADVEFNGYEAEELGAAKFENKSSSFSGATHPRSVYVRDGELYFNDSSGNEVKLTSSGQLNAGGLGGIEGDYGSSYDASLYFDDATSTFRFLESAALRALIDCGQILLRESLTNGVYAVKLTSPAGLGADVTRTFLGTNPASTSLLQISAAGAESTTTSPSLTAVTLADDDCLHAERTYVCSAARFNTATATASTAVTGVVTVSGAGAIILPLDVAVGQRLKSASVVLDDDSTTAIDVSVYKQASNVATQIGSTESSSGAGTVQTKTVGGLTETIATGTCYFILVSSLANNDKIISYQYVVDRVA